MSKDVGSLVSHTQMLQQGARVIIVKTDNVVQRAPEMIGQVGEIKAVPQHPNTWFKVKLSNGRVFTLRPSALRLATGKDKDKDKAKGGSTVAADAGRAEQLDGDTAATSARAADSMTATVDPAQQSANNTSPDELLSATEANSWTGRQVMVKVGKNYGTVGVVLGSGNGWVQLRTKKGEIAKRAYELELVASEADAQAKLAKAEAQAAAAAKAAAVARAANKGNDAAAAQGDAAAPPQQIVTSWLRKRVQVPDGRVGLVTKVERGICTCGISASPSLDLTDRGDH